MNVSACDSESSDDVDSVECLQELLGGLSPADVPLEAWDYSPAEAVGEEKRSTTEKRKKNPPICDENVTSNEVLPQPQYQSIREDETFALAYTCSGYCTPNGKIESPPVRIVEFNHQRERGLVASRKITKGSVIFTERAFLASPEDSVRACQHCFRSMEPRLAVSKSLQSSQQNKELPLSHLWPIPDYTFDDTIDQEVSSCRADGHGRLQCRDCESWFCSAGCRQAFQYQLGSCCLVEKAAKLAKPWGESAISWATRMFLYDTVRFRKNNELFLSKATTPISSLCGTRSDLKALDLLPSDGGETSLQPLYGDLVSLLNLNAKEKTILSLEHLETLVCKVARNGISMRTQSPFKPYHAALLRHSGRGSETHQRHLDMIAQVFGQQKLTKDLDQRMDALVAPLLTAVCCLTARLNHSCDPNARIEGQAFVDAHLDVVATRDIQEDEEIYISYIAGANHKSIAQRRRELQARYMFYCECSACTNNFYNNHRK